MHDARAAKEAALKKLMDLMDSRDLEGLKGLKAGKTGELAVAKMEVPDEEEGEEPTDFQKAWEEMKGKGPAEEMGEGEDEESDTDELSPEEKEQIRALYEKHCK